MILGVFLYVCALILSFTGIFYGIGIVFEGFKRYREAVLIADTPTSKLESVATGPAAVGGTAETTGPELVAPIVQRSCIAYDLTVADEGSGSSRTPLSEFRSVSFALADGSDDVRITADALENARLDVTAERRRELEIASYDEPPDHVTAFERDRDLPSRGMTYDRTFEISWLEPGDDLYVHGRIEPDATAATADGRRPADRHARKRIDVHDDGPRPFLSNKPPSQILSERKYGLAKATAKGFVVAVVSLPVFLWLSGIAPIFLIG